MVNRITYDIEPIRKKIEEFKSLGKKIFATSSFQTHSIPLLHIISEIDRSIPIYFTNTGFLFPETLAFKDQLAEMFGLQIIALPSPIPKIQQLNEKGHFYYTSDPDYCCFLNKVLPLENILAEYDVWINGIRSDQSAVRRNMQEIMPAPHGCLRYHPLLHWDKKMIFQYIKDHRLPSHPLEKQGYLSIGCVPCTEKVIDPDDERSGRWSGLQKKECGLHTELVKNVNNR